MMSQGHSNEIESTLRLPRRKWPIISAVVVAAIIGLWQYWSWGPYTVTLEAEATKTKDFVMECSYAARSLHSLGRQVHRHVFIMGSGQSNKCPRYFLGPFGTGMSVNVYHPRYIEYWLHMGGKFRAQTTALHPQSLGKVLAEQMTQAEKREVLSTHLLRLENRYLPEFDLSERNTLADRHVGELQEFARLAGGINRPVFDQKSMEYIDNLFRKPRK